MVEIPQTNNVNAKKPAEPEKAKKIKVTDIKGYLLYVFFAVLLVFAVMMYLKSAKNGQNKFYSSGKQFSFVKRNDKFNLLRKYLPVLFVKNNVSIKQEDPKKLKSQNLICNGIVFSPENKLALINNIIVREGDTIGDVVVLQIRADYVELGNSALRFKLTPYKK